MAKRVNGAWSEHDYITCGVCKTYVQEPKLLNCLHFFCKKCIQVKVSLSQNETINCPTCNEPTDVSNNDLEQIPTLTHIQRMKEQYTLASQAKKKRVACEQCKETPFPATMYCITCGFVCEKCSQAHKEFKVFENHEIVAIDTMKNNISKYVRIKDPPCCGEHGKPAKNYCCTCERLVCEDCYTIGRHVNHTQRAVSLKRREDFSSLENQIPSLKRNQDRMTREAANIESIKQEIDSNVRITRQEIETIFGQARKVLQQREEELKVDVASTGREMKAELDAQLQKCTADKSKLAWTSWMIETCLQSESDMDIVACYKPMSRRAIKLTHCTDVRNTTPVTPAEVHLEIDPNLTERLGEVLRQKIRVTGPQASTTKSVIGGCIQNAVVGEVTSFHLHTKYDNDQPCVTSQNVEAELVSPKCSALIKAEVVCESKGTYEVSYTPTVRGRHSLHVRVNNKELEGSPFTVSVYMPPTKIQEQQECHKFNQPYQIAFTYEGDLLVLESTENGRVLKKTPEGYEEFRKPIPASEELNNPQGIATAPDGSVYIVYDGDSHARVVKYSKDGVDITQYSDGGKKLKRPGRIKYNEEDNCLYICDRANNCFQVFDSYLKLKKSFAEHKRLYSDIAFSDNGHMYLSNKEGNCIFKLKKDGTQVCQFGQKHLKAPRGLLYQHGHLYVADRDNKRIAVFETQSGHYNLVTSFTSPKCRDPGSVTADAEGNLYVCDERGGHLFVF